ncbi:efflux RND transporter permease subunit [Hyphococcus luteus]|uniref:RND transporter n=1 Tax=Hyphococcus luteus TaxID=2058213 RepID=A0A2S7KAL9_9PROT|nr:MMPL family transporter [Marinicaulis flavus]PQA89523.1 RND transporter [Marinicaulis flavus]
MNVLPSSAAQKPGLYLWGAALFSLILIALVAAPTFAPRAFSFLEPLKVDTDPENMLSADEPVRVFHNDMKKEFNLHDLIVVGVVNEKNEDGVFNTETLGDVYELTKFAETIRWTDGASEDAAKKGVIAVDIIAPSTVDSIEQAGLGSVSFDWLMPAPPETREEALAVREKAERIPTLNDTLVSGDGKALAIYVPITAKDVSFRVANQLREKIATFDGDAEYHITGLPIAQDQFGVEMFKQMAISAPLAMALIFALMWWFFRRLNLIISPMIVAMVSVIGAMGLLVVTGNTVHIMSSMIPIFVMPIAVLDAVHILSDFYDRYPSIRDRRKTLDHVMKELWQPMLFTTLTTCTGFLSLAFTPIPPVQVFGVFVAIGVFFAWFFTITLIPAYIMVMPEKAFAGFGMGAGDKETDHEATPLARFLHGVGDFAVGRSKLIVAGFLLALVVAGYGVTQIRINDNPVKWFHADHEIRVADRALNDRFGGTYMAYLALTADEGDALSSIADDVEKRLTALGTPQAEALAASARAARGTAESPDAFLSALREKAETELDAAEADEDWYAWDDAVLALDAASQSQEIFKQPETLRYIEKLQAHLETTGLVGKSNALPDIVKTVHRDLFLGDEEAYRIPDTPEAVAQTLITYQNSHRPQDLFKLVTPDFKKSVLWLQLKSGDNVDMSAVIADVDKYIADNPPPAAISHDWFGLTYINVAWQQKMVSGMARAFAGSFIMVLVLMTILFRSPSWGLLSMAPLTVTIGVIYGVIGLIGKDYDMPVAVLSSLSLGLAIDYAIHFNARTRHLYEQIGDWPQTAKKAFGEPARAIFRNVIVIGVGFLPLLLAPLVPYQTVGIFISAILFLAGVATLLGLPALITIFKPILFRKRRTQHAV